MREKLRALICIYPKCRAHEALIDRLIQFIEREYESNKQRLKN